MTWGGFFAFVVKVTPLLPDSPVIALFGFLQILYIEETMNKNWDSLAVLERKNDML